jgi:hypothetical protein
LNYRKIPQLVTKRRFVTRKQIKIKVAKRRLATRRILIAGGLVWATTQVCKKAIREGKTKYIYISALGSAMVALLIVLTMGPWSWLSFAWVSYGGWLAANLGHKLYDKYLRKLVEKHA